MPQPNESDRDLAPRGQEIYREAADRDIATSPRALGKRLGWVLSANVITTVRSLGRNG